MNEAFPVLPFRTATYTPDELFAGFDPARPGSYADTPDFRTFRSTWQGGGRPSRDIGMLRALHDQSITEARDDLVEGRRVVAIMGGHALARNDAAYAVVARLAAGLSRSGFLVATGGGPGAMEASHLGALLADHDDAAMDEALALLAAAPEFPKNASRVIDDAGGIDADALAELHAWQRPAFEVLASVPVADRGDSLAIPTWFYGHEPPTPFATHIAKYFANAIREDGLLAIAVDGIVFSPGRAGTLQEIFQEACQNYYRTFHRRFSPMAFLDLDGCWSERFPVETILRPLFGDDDHDRHVCLSADADELLRFLVEHDPTAGRHRRLRPGGPKPTD